MSDLHKLQKPFILFELGKTLYGIPSRLVQQMEMIDQITPVPKAPSFVEGVVLSRGQIISVVNLRVRFGFNQIAHDTRTRLIVVNIGGRTIGLIVDTAREFVSIPTEIIQPPPEKLSGLSGKYLAGIAKLGSRLILILEVQELLNFSEIEDIKSIESPTVPNLIN